VSERFACHVLGQHRSTQRKIAKTPDDEAALTADIIAFDIQYGDGRFMIATARGPANSHSSFSIRPQRGRQGSTEKSGRPSAQII
jgi:hypothetical protein